MKTLSSTEKTLGKLELLNSYCELEHSNDKTLGSIINNIMQDFETKQEPKVESTVKRQWSPERRERQMKANKARRDAKKVILPKKNEIVSNETVKKFPEKIDLSKLNGVDRKTFKNSTVINQVTYNKATKVMNVIERKGKSKEFHNVPEPVKRELFLSKKPGKFYNKYILPIYGKKEATV
jgi:hypothetical protein